MPARNRLSRRVVLFVVLLGLVAALPVFAGGRREDVPPPPPEDLPAAPEDPGVLLPVDPQVRIGVLPTGLTYFIRENREPRNQSRLRLAINAGSVLEDEDQLGLAHFVEHMAFNGTENYSGNEIIAFLEQLGMQFGPDVNAYTSFDETVYQLSVPTDDPALFAEAFAVLREWADRLTFAQEEVDAERGVVIEEWRFGRGAQARMRDEQFPVIFGDSRYAERLPIGDPELIAEFPTEAALRFYRDWYRPDLAAIVAVGDFDADAVEALIREQFADFTGPEDPREREVFSIPDREGTHYAIASDPETQFTQISVYSIQEGQAPALRTEDDYRAVLARNLFTAMLNVRLQEIGRQANAPFLAAESGGTRLARTKTAFAMSAAVSENEVEPALQAMILEARRVREFGFTQSELERARDTLLRNIEQIFRERDNINSAAFADEYVRAFLEDEAIPGIPFERELTERLIPEIGLAELNSLADRFLSPDNRVVVVSALEREGLEPARRADLEAAIDAALAADLDPPQERERPTRLLASLPQAGQAGETTELDAEDVMVFELSNGARVVYQQTSHRADQVQFSAFSPGGTSRVPDERYWPAVYATIFTEQMGYGTRAARDIEEALAGRAVTVQPYIAGDREGFTGSASAEDLAVLMELVHLKMSGARPDEGAFNALREQLVAFVRTQEAQPQFQLSRAYQEALTGGHPRTMPFTEDDLPTVTLPNIVAAYNSRFANASDFTFVFVGTIEPEELIALSEQYLASLPGSRERETVADVGIRYAEAPVETEVRAGIEPISQVIVTWHGNYDFSQASNYAIRALERMLSIRLQEVIREDEGGTYGVGVQAEFRREPQGRYEILTTFRADPERVDELTGRLFEVIQALRTELVDESYIRRIQEVQRTDFESGLTSNQFWIQQIEFALRADRPMSAIREYLDLVEGLNAQALQDAAREYLRDDAVVQVTLLPEENDG